ncbi:MAG: helix-turn-helix transcriptional regulator [Clostridium cadaveris]|uniref:Transcriptional regulator, PadR family n=1 Tax=Clostridium cadaveris TaxID=1529 RepID=A0A1I2QX17_9CLOT|nr:helix-turn-helix transcriptional regulator [Clostridium cadaveris]MDU4953966.1 helix-turn-helix transcriptional regulator [Clostridium sp.]MDM8313576.1 helix-turn-helix transcriptional regulator [Clostridium cadaveris]MDY4948803.1 helix-turn-helix transcriptional regulator [Clostridium cadaveris]NME63463.1 PadR family transcriptional regulator [Clostridium cadaveris]NWK09735.1 helix-turn-helix transcriptional regulator [Clostridium cadaveris]
MKVDKSLITGSTTMLVLSLLKDGDKYGYEMIKELEKKSDETFSLKEGTLYPILHGLEVDGMVESYSKESEMGRKRKYYRLTKKGLRLLEEKKEEWNLFASKVNKVLGGSGYALA